MATLALDLGERRVGVAVNEVGGIVLPLPTVAVDTAESLVAEVGLIVAERNVDTIVIGSTRPGSALDALKILLADRIGVRLVEIDEALTSKEAERQLSAQGQRGDTDAVAAQLLLEQYLAERAAE